MNRNGPIEPNTEEGRSRIIAQAKIDALVWTANYPDLTEADAPLRDVRRGGVDAYAAFSKTDTNKTRSLENNNLARAVFMIEFIDVVFSELGKRTIAARYEIERKRREREAQLRRGTSQPSRWQDATEEGHDHP